MSDWPPKQEGLPIYRGETRYWNADFKGGRRREISDLESPRARYQAGRRLVRRIASGGVAGFGENSTGTHWTTSRVYSEAWANENMSPHNSHPDYEHLRYASVIWHGVVDDPETQIDDPDTPGSMAHSRGRLRAEREVPLRSGTSLRVTGASVRINPPSNPREGRWMHFDLGARNQVPIQDSRRSGSQETIL